LLRLLHKYVHILNTPALALNCDYDKLCELDLAYFNQMERNMKIETAISAVLAMSLATGGIAFAQDRGDRNDRSRKEHLQSADQHDDRHNDRRPSERGVGPNHQFRRGDRLPVEYRHRNHVVNDWRGRHLNAPPRGYYWVQSGADYVLVAVATGIILQILLNN